MPAKDGARFSPSIIRQLRARGVLFAPALAILMAATSLACARVPNKDTSMAISWVEPEIFNGIQYGTSLPYACTPEFGWQRGIELHAPERVHLKQAPEPAIPVCGSALLQTNSKDDLVIHVLQRETGKTFTSVYVESPPAIPGILYDPISDHEFPEVDTSVSDDHSSGMAFNINAATTVTAPLTPGRYEVHVTCGNLRSNTVVVEVLAD